MNPTENLNQGGAKIKLCSVDFLNSTPLVWGLMHGPQRGTFDLTFAIPSRCADLLASGQAHIGNVPVIEYARQGLEMVRGVGVACHGSVRSILLISRVPLPEVNSLAADISSRTSVALAQIVLARKYGAFPIVQPARPDLDAMLASSDAALIIGDPALHIDPSTVPYRVFDLGQEWFDLTGLPMVFAVWAGKQQYITPEVESVLRASCHFGRENLEAIIATDAVQRGIDEGLAREYLTQHIVNELGPRDYQGLERYLDYARELGLTAPSPAIAGQV